MGTSAGGGPAPEGDLSPDPLSSSWVLLRGVTALLQALGGNGTRPCSRMLRGAGQVCLVAPETGLQRGQGWGVSPADQGPRGGLDTRLPSRGLLLPTLP